LETATAGCRSLLGQEPDRTCTAASAVTSSNRSTSPRCVRLAQLGSSLLPNCLHDLRYHSVHPRSLGADQARRCHRAPAHCSESQPPVRIPRPGGRRAPTPRTRLWTAADSSPA
jgi:hypothetical protein